MGLGQGYYEATGMLGTARENLSVPSASAMEGGVCGSASVRTDWICFIPFLLSDRQVFPEGRFPAKSKESLPSPSSGARGFENAMTVRFRKSFTRERFENAFTGEGFAVAGPLGRRNQAGHAFSMQNRRPPFPFPLQCQPLVPALWFF